MWLDKLNAFKKQSGKTSEQISIESGVPKGTVNKIFAGQTKDPQYNTLRAIIHTLGHTIDDLDENNEKTAPASEDAEAEKDFLLYAKDLHDFLVNIGVVEQGQQLTDRQVKFLSNQISALITFFED